MNHPKPWFSVEDWCIRLNARERERERDRGQYFVAGGLNRNPETLNPKHLNPTPLNPRRTHHDVFLPVFLPPKWERSTMSKSTSVFLPKKHAKSQHFCHIPPKSQHFCPVPSKPLQGYLAHKEGGVSHCGEGDLLPGGGAEQEAGARAHLRVAAPHICICVYMYTYIYMYI